MSLPLQVSLDELRKRSIDDNSHTRVLLRLLAAADDVLKVCDENDKLNYPAFERLRTARENYRKVTGA